MLDATLGEERLSSSAKGMMAKRYEHGDQSMPRGGRVCERMNQMGGGVEKRNRRGLKRRSRKAGIVAGSGRGGRGGGSEEGRDGDVSARRSFRVAGKQRSKQ